MIQTTFLTTRMSSAQNGIWTAEVGSSTHSLIPMGMVMERSDLVGGEYNATCSVTPQSYAAVCRICVGKDLAVQSLSINFAVMLWGLNISAAVDKNGKPIIPSATALVDRGVTV